MLDYLRLKKSGQIRDCMCFLQKTLMQDSPPSDTPSYTVQQKPHWENETEDSRSINKLKAH